MRFLKTSNKRKREVKTHIVKTLLNKKSLMVGWLYVKMNYRIGIISIKLELYSFNTKTDLTLINLLTDFIQLFFCSKVSYL